MAAEIIDYLNVISKHGFKSVNKKIKSIILPIFRMLCNKDHISKRTLLCTSK